MENFGSSPLTLVSWLLPAILAVIGLMFMVGAVRSLIRGNRLTSQGLPTRGTVQETYVHHYGRNDSRRPYRVETIEFVTGAGQRVRNVPAVIDTGMLDRTGQRVDVLYDREHPDQFIAPKNGRTLSPAKPIVRIGIGVAALLIASMVFVFALGF